MKILYLCNKGIYTKKMSRVRFDGIDAIKRYPGIDLLKHGVGWGNFNLKRIEKEFKPDLIVWYKPLTIPRHESVKTPCCIRYNEMYDTSWTKHEIKNSKSNLVICHHFNDIQRYAGNLDPKFKLVHNPHCGEVDIFKDYGLKKKVDVLLVGKKGRQFYPLRRKLDGKVKKMLRKRGIKFETYKHPGYKLKGLEAIRKQNIHYAKAINRAKIVVSCASKLRYALAKYVEVPLCRTVLCGNLPDENQEWYKKWMLPISMDNNATQICGKIINLLKDSKGLQKLTDLGYRENLKHRTQEDYARRFVNIATDFLNGDLKDYDFGKDSMRYLNGKDGVI